MKKQLQLSINLPFAYYTELDSATGAPLFRYPSPGMIRQYADALCAEMDLWKDCSEVEISSIRFEGGYIHLLKEEQLSQLLDKIQAIFSLSGDCEWIALTCPGRYLTGIAPLLAARRFKILLDIPTFIKEEADSHMLPFGPEFARGELADFPAAGIRMLREVDGRTSEQVEMIRIKLSEIRPARVEMVALNGRNEETLAGCGLQEYLLQTGYRRVCVNEYALPEGEFRHRHDIPSLSEYIGLGLGAVSAYDSYLSRNVGDFKAYVAASGNPAMLYKEVKKQPADL